MGSPRGQHRHVEPGLAGAGAVPRSGSGATPVLGRGFAGSLVDPAARLRTGRLGLRGTPNHRNAQGAAATWLRPAVAWAEERRRRPPHRESHRASRVRRIQGGWSRNFGEPHLLRPTRILEAAGSRGLGPANPIRWATRSKRFPGKGLWVSRNVNSLAPPPRTFMRTASHRIS